MKWMLCLALAGCSLTLELDGPAGTVAVAPDRGPVDAAIDARTPVRVDAGPDASPPPEEVEVRGPVGARVVRHPGGAGAEPPVDLGPEGRVRLPATRGDAVTLVIEDEVDGRSQAWLVTVAGLQPGDVVPIAHPAPQPSRVTSLFLRLAGRQADAAGYVVGNGCVELRCEGMNCAPWFDGRERSLAATDRCVGPDGGLRTLAVALSAAGERLAWARADDAFPVEDAQHETTFGPWQADWHPIALTVSGGVERVTATARPWDGVAFGAGPGQRKRLEGGRAELALVVPASFVPGLELGVDQTAPGPDTVRDRPARAWRWYPPTAPEAVTLAFDDEVPAVPTEVTLLVDDEGAQPGLAWSAEAGPEVVARIEQQWSVAQGVATWVGFGPASARAARLPPLPDALAHLRPSPGTEVAFGQVTLVRCDGVDDDRAHRQRPCPIYGAGFASPAGRSIAWSSALGALPPPPPDAGPPDAGPVDAGPADAGP